MGTRSLSLVGLMTVLLATKAEGGAPGPPLGHTDVRTDPPSCDRLFDRTFKVRRKFGEVQMRVVRNTTLGEPPLQPPRSMSSPTLDQTARLCQRLGAGWRVAMDSHGEKFAKEMSRRSAGDLAKALAACPVPYRHGEMCATCSPANDPFCPCAGRDLSDWIFCELPPSSASPAGADEGPTLSLGNLGTAWAPGRGGSGPQACQVHPAEPTVTVRAVSGPPWAREALRARLGGALLGELRACYVRANASQPRLCGEVGADFDVSAEGKIGEPRFATTGRPWPREPALVSCVARTLHDLGTLPSPPPDPDSPPRHHPRPPAPFELGIHLDFSAP
jgi:hypothetical protein